MSSVMETINPYLSSNIKIRSIRLRKGLEMINQSKDLKTKGKNKIADVSKKYPTCTKCMPGTDDMH